MKTKLTFAAAFILILTLLFTACSGADKDKDRQENEPTPKKTWETPSVSYMADEESLNEVLAIMDGAGLKSAEFKKLVDDYNSVNGMTSCFKSGWIKPDEMEKEHIDCVTAWENAGRETDGNCRLTALLLLEDMLEYDASGEEYDGTYLMFDFDAIENSPAYSKRDRELLAALFGEKPMDKDIASTYAENWKKHGFKLKNENVSLISIVFEDTFGETAFVGHTGVLIKTEEGLLFVEKLAFEQPYVAIKASNTDQIIKILSERSEYAIGESENPAAIFNNDECIGSIGE